MLKWVETNEVVKYEKEKTSGRKGGRGKGQESCAVCVWYTCVWTVEKCFQTVEARLKSTPNDTRMHKLQSLLTPEYLDTFWYSPARVHVGPKQTGCFSLPQGH